MDIMQHTRSDRVHCVGLDTTWTGSTCPSGHVEVDDVDCKPGDVENFEARKSAAIGGCLGPLRTRE
jgi:hypothetical protein